MRERKDTVAVGEGCVGGQELRLSPNALILSQQVPKGPDTGRPRCGSRAGPGMPEFRVELQKLYEEVA